MNHKKLIQRFREINSAGGKNAIIAGNSLCPLLLDLVDGVGAMCGCGHIDKKFMAASVRTSVAYAAVIEKMQELEEEA